MKKVLIAIQARSTSVRLPRKAFEYIGNYRLLDHVIDACKKAALYSNKFTDKKGFGVDVALLIPYDDPIKDSFECEMIEGPELDVLKRYHIGSEYYKPDYICRITGDCPLIPPYIITKHVSLAVGQDYDYISNVDEECRLTLDGIDCEVMSYRMLNWLHENAKSPPDREHVTLLARKNPPKWAKMGFTMPYFNFANVKLSVDTMDDLQRVRKEYEALAKSYITAQRIYGTNIHRF